MTIWLAIKAHTTECHTKTEIVQIPAKINRTVVIIGVCLVRISGRVAPFWVTNGCF